MTQTRVAGTERSDFCNRCFKDSPKLHYVDGQEIYLCGGCGYDLRAWTNFLKANGVQIRRIMVYAWESGKEDSPEENGNGIEGVEGGERPSTDSKTRRKPKE